MEEMTLADEEKPEEVPAVSWRERKRHAKERDAALLDEPTEPTKTEEELIEDRAYQSMGFRAWLSRNADERYEPLRKAILKSGLLRVRYNRDEVLAALQYEEELMEALIKAEFEWRADMAANNKLRDKLDIKVDTRFDFRNPTMAHSQKCRFVNDLKKTCGLDVVPGTVRCRWHGGELVDAATRRAVLMTSYLQLVEATGVAVEALVDIAVRSRNDLARVNAAREILDRAGLTAELQVSVTIDGVDRDSKLVALRSKLDAMQTGLTSKVVDVVGREVDRTMMDNGSVPVASE